MSLYIEELVIKASIEPSRCETVETTSVSTTASSGGALSHEERAGLIQECVEQVMEILQETKEY